MTQQNHDNAQIFLKEKYLTANENSQFGFNEVVSILAEYTVKIQNSNKIQNRYSRAQSKQNYYSDRLFEVIPIICKKTGLTPNDIDGIMYEDGSGVRFNYHVREYDGTKENGWRFIEAGIL